MPCRLVSRLVRCLAACPSSRSNPREIYHAVPGSSRHALNDDFSDDLIIIHDGKRYALQVLLYLNILYNIHSFVWFINLEYRRIIVNQQLLIASSGVFSNLTILMRRKKRIECFNSCPDPSRLVYKSSNHRIFIAVLVHIFRSAVYLSVLPRDYSMIYYRR